MTQSLHPAAQQGFSAAAELYQQVRPDYPADLSPWLAETLSLPVDANLVDLGTELVNLFPICVRSAATSPPLILSLKCWPS